VDKKRKRVVRETIGDFLHLLYPEEYVPDDEQALLDELYTAGFNVRPLEHHKKGNK